MIHASKLFLTVGLLMTVLPATARDGFANVDGLKMYYQIQGQGRPLVLLHGGLCTIESCLGKLRTALGTSRTIVAIEQQGHGRTADLDRPLTFDQMANDTAALLRTLNIDQADFFGYSDGGNVAIRLAMLHPKLVSKVVVLGTNFDNSGLAPGLVDAFKTIKVDDIPKEFQQAYARVAPHPNQWSVLVSKVMKQALEFPGWQAQDLKAIAAPVLFMIGDQDIVRPEHAIEMSRLLPHANLAILPATDHFAPVVRADWIARITEDFLRAPMPEAN